jgi:hypothetical protein
MRFLQHPLVHVIAGMLGVQAALWGAFGLGLLLCQLPIGLLVFAATLVVGALITAKMLAVGGDDLPEPEGE